MSHSRRIAGLDLGKASAKLVVVAAGVGSEVEVLERRHLAHDGRPFDVLRAWYREAELASCDALGVTGLHSLEVVGPAIAGLPEDACLESAIRARRDLGGPLRIVSVGARGYSVLARGNDGHVTWLENDKCSSGTGETIVKIAGRFGLGVEEADRLALGAGTAIPITARCSVFAKSEMTHFGNQGRPVDQLFRGYFESVARIVSALLERARVDGPTYVVGGGSRIAMLVDALRRMHGDVRVPDDALFLEALGAAVIASEQARAQSLPPLPADPGALLSERGRRLQVLEPASRHAGRVRRLAAHRPPEGAERAPTVLGLDLGSTGSKAALTSIATGELVLDVYDRTRGNPVEATRRLVASILDRGLDVRAIGVTGSGREAVATVLRAAYPDAAGRIVVQNEIVAHATAAIRCDEEGGRSLSVVEIGGQDAKFIQIAGGQIVESDMNKACSAGTGSFLEEQALFYGVPEIEEFTRLATEAERPPDLGQMCTVFVAEAAAEAESQGFGLADLFAGFQYSVIHNYKNRVMGERSFGERIFFQGKPATGPSLAWTLAAVVGREVVVPPNPGAMGAFGIGLSVLGDLGEQPLLDAPSFDLAAIPAARVVERGEIRCQDPRCATLCHIDRTVVAVGEATRAVLSGGACPKFEVSSASRPKLPLDAPSPFDERQRLLAPFMADRAGTVTLGVPVVGALTGVVPWIATFLAELGLGVRALRPDSRSLARGEERSWSYDACAPVKVAHGVADAEIDLLFFPKVFALRDREGPGGRTCAMEQALPEMVDRALRARGRSVRVNAPILDFRSPEEMLGPLGSFAVSLGIDPRRVPDAAHRAREAQEDYEEELGAIGDRALRYGRRHGIPVVAVCGSLHVIHDPVVSAGIPGILRQNGVLPLPMDCFRIPDGVGSLPRIAWGDASRALRVALAARERGDVYPLLLGSFGCGPASFSEHVFHSLMEGHPHTALESDGHGGAAGYVTRVQAFLHAVRQHDGRASAVPPERMQWLEPLAEPSFEEEKGSRLVVLAMSDRFSPLLAAVYRSFGFDAVASGPASAATLSLGRRDCSGKECLPYQLMWGSFRQTLEASPPTRRTVLLQVTGDGACRNCMFSVKDQISLDRLGVADRVVVRHIKAQPTMPMAFVIRLWATVVAWDILHQLAAYFRAGERSSGEVDRLYGRYCDELERLVSQPSRRSALGRGTEWLSLVRLVEEAARAFAALGANGQRANGTRTVLLTGDVYVRLDEFGSDGLARRLAERGMRVLVEPFSVLAEYVALERSSDLLGLPIQLLDNAAFRGVMAAVRRALYRRARPTHPWMPMPSVPGRVRESRRVIARHPIGEAPITVGSVIHAWNERHCDGVVVISPWGCGPALISESLLRHHREIPMLFVYADGSPIDERRLNGFTFRLRQSPPRSVARS